MQQSEFAPNLVYDTPVVTLEGVNHTHYFSGQIPANFTYTDIEGDISYPEAWANISRYVVAFMITQAQSPAEEVPPAQALLRAAFADNQERMGVRKENIGMKGHAGGQGASKDNIWTKEQHRNGGKI